jgi:hypothetical protein
MPESARLVFLPHLEDMEMSCSVGRLGPEGALLGAMMIAIMPLPGHAQSQSNQLDQVQRQSDPSGEVQSQGEQHGQAQGESNQDESTSRGVRIIDAPTLSPSGGSPSPVLKSPGPEIPSPTLLAPAASPALVPALAPPVAATQPVPVLTPQVLGATPPAPALLSPAPELRPIRPAPALVAPAADRPNVGALPAAPTLVAPAVPYGTPANPPPAINNFADLPKQPDAGVATPADIGALSAGLKIPNLAGLSMQILPGPDIAVGSQVSFQVSSKKPGYLIIVDVEATGKLVQIYPNPMSLIVPGGVRENANYLRPGKPLRIPDPGNLYAGFDFVASPPTGTAMVVAILGDRPVQLVDLPDVPASLAGSASAVEYLTKFANGLRIPDSNGSGRLAEAHWSFDAKFYAIR